MTRTLPVRRLAAVAAPLLLAASLTACGGGGGGAPEEASQEDFCSAYNAEGANDDFDAEASPEDQAEQLKNTFDEAADKLTEVGTPSDIPDDAREGFEIFVDTIKDVDQDDLQKAIEDQDEEALEADVSDEDKEKVDAFTNWADDYCDDSSEAPSDTES